jgi:hypothetical protein
MIEKYKSGGAQNLSETEVDSAQMAVGQLKESTGAGDKVCVLERRVESPWLKNQSP